MVIHDRSKNVCARGLIALSPPGHRSKRLDIHRFFAGEQWKRFDDACAPPVTRTVVYSWHLFRDGIANECRLCAVQRLITGMCRTPLATAPHANIKNWNRISRPSLYFILSPFTYQSVTWKRGLDRKCAHFVVVLLKSVFSLISRVLLYCTTDFKCDRYPERRSGMSDASFPAGILGLSSDSPGRSLQVILFPCTITWSATYIYVWSHDQQHNVG